MTDIDALRNRWNAAVDARNRREQAEVVRDMAADLREQQAEIERLRAERDVARQNFSGDDALDAFGYLTLLRGNGWRVAVHNDYRQHGQDWTFWLLTHPSGRWVKGEGVSDGLALAQAHDAGLGGREDG